MNIYSKTEDVTQHSVIVKSIAEKLGVSEDGVDNVIKKKLKLVTPSEHSNFYKNIEKEYLGATVEYDANYYKKLFDETLKSNDGNKNIAVNAVIHTLNNNLELTDTINTLAVVKDLLLISNQKDADKLGKLLGIDKNVNLTVLNESINFQFNIDTVVDYKTLSSILTRNNKRWYTNNQVYGSYEQINAYIANKINDLENSNIVGFDDNYDKNILFEYINGNISALNVDYSINKHMVNNIQSIVFDMSLMINKYIKNNENKLLYINNEKVINYYNLSNGLIENLYSSMTESNVLNKHYIEDVINGKFDSSGAYENDMSIIDNLTSAINIPNISMQLMKLNNLFSMLNYIHSASGDFNLKIRKLLKAYINTTRNILTKINRL